MTAVRLRHKFDSRALPIGDVPFADLGSVIPTLNSWGIDDYEGCSLSGQFVYAESGAYFEVIIHADGEDE